MNIRKNNTNYTNATKNSNNSNNSDTIYESHSEVSAERSNNGIGDDKIGDDSGSQPITNLNTVSNQSMLSAEHHNNNCDCYYRYNDNNERKIGLQKIFNPPGLSSLKYRIGTHSTFKKQMLAKIPHKRALFGLTTRNDSDLIISLFDAWATVSDVLTFYQERIANEGFLETAIDRFSILELARPIGYELSPGLAAHTYLVFTLESTPETLDNVTIITKGTRVQSLPNQNEMPQTFESVNDTCTFPEWNELLPYVTKPQVLNVNKLIKDSSPRVYLNEISPQLKLGSKILIKLPQGDNLENGNESDIASLLCGTVSRIDKDEKCVYFSILSVVKSTIVDEDTKKASRDEKPGESDPNLLVYKILVNIGQAFGIKPPDGTDVIAKFNLMFNEKIRDSIKNWHQNDLITFAAQNHFPRRKFFELFNYEAQKKIHKKVVEYNDINNAHCGIYLLSGKASLFGHNAPAYNSLPDSLIKSLVGNDGDHWKTNWDDPNNPMDIGQFHNRLNHTVENDTKNNDVKIYLDNVYQTILSDTWIIFEDSRNGIVLPYEISKVSERTVADFLFTSKVSEISLKPYKMISAEKILGEEEDQHEKVDNRGIENKKNNILNLDLQWDSFFEFTLRQTSVYTQSEKLTNIALDRRLSDADANENKSSQKSTVELGIEEKYLILDHVVDGLSIGQPVSITGILENSSGQNMVNELAIIDNIDLAEDKFHTKLTFRNNLLNRYDKNTLKVNANVVYATHGETKEEIIGSGDPSQKHQEFILKQKPLTFISIPTSSGLISTLEVYVDGIQWKEVSSFNNIVGDDTSYIVRIDNDGNVHVIFGDGVSGSLLPAGIDNITAKYRIGIGKEGLLKKNQLQLLIDRPLGVKSVTNPEDTVGAEDPENVNSASENTSKSIITLGTMVSLQDFENFSASFAGVGKAKASEIWNGKEHVICITVASSLGKAVDENSDLYKNLKNAIEKNKDPLIQFHLDTFELKYFSVSATIEAHKSDTTNKYLVGINLDQGLLKKQVEDALHERFSFVHRQFAQSITKDEIIKVIQHIEGVNRITITSFHESTDDSDSEDMVRNEIKASDVIWPYEPSDDADFKTHAVNITRGQNNNKNNNYYNSYENTLLIKRAELLVIHPDSGPNAVDITIV